MELYLQDVIDENIDFTLFETYTEENHEIFFSLCSLIMFFMLEHYEFNNEGEADEGNIIAFPLLIKGEEIILAV